MKIAFITSCLESGKDGVGDYTRLLAAECVRRGHECCLISLNDHFLTQISQLETVVDSVKFATLRLPASIPWKCRIAYVRDFLDALKPEWLSLQFVPYGFQDKGIVIDLSKWLRPLIQGRQLHIMFHELWIGNYVGAKQKERLIGTVQKFFILRLVNQLQPAVVHTSNSAYVAILNQQGISTHRLPIFGNIPISEHNADSWLFLKLQKLGLDIRADNRDHFWLFGIFGTLHPVWPAEPLFTYLHQAATQHQRRIVIISIGRLGTGEKLWENLSKDYSHRFVFLQLGEQLSIKISEFFNSIDFGISTTPYLTSGKSGTVAAMIEHGIPVIVNRDDFQPLSCPIPQHEHEPLLIKMDSNLSLVISDYLQKQIAQPRIPSVALKFIEDLKNSSSIKI